MRLRGHAPQSRLPWKAACRTFLSCLLLQALSTDPALTVGAAAQAANPAAIVSTLPEGKLFTPEQLTALLPATVYFQGKSAPLQLRNAAGLRFPGKSIFWTGLVDTSGYASDVQEKYEFYLVTEGPLRIGTTVLPPGAYGGGLHGGHFLIMDLGGHTLAQGPTQDLPASVRPRPLQLLTTAADAATLCLRRQCVAMNALAGDAQ